MALVAPALARAPLGHLGKTDRKNAADGAAATGAWEIVTVRTEK